MPDYELSTSAAGIDAAISAAQTAVQPADMPTLAAVATSGSYNDLIDQPTLLKGDKGDPGSSAYDVAVAGGFVGTEAQWLASLEGADGTSVTITVAVDQAAYDAATPSALELVVLNA